MISWGDIIQVMEVLSPLLCFTIINVILMMYVH